jgi:hypothetical protein
MGPGTTENGRTALNLQRDKHAQDAKHYINNNFRIANFNSSISPAICIFE